MHNAEVTHVHMTNAFYEFYGWRVALNFIVNSFGIHLS
jgi:hypothetical protein